MPTFCRHNRFIQNCPICSKSDEAGPLAAAPAPAPRRPAGARTGPRSPARLEAAGVRVRRPARTSDDGFRSALVPGVKSRQDATALAEEIAFAAGRLAVLATDPPGPYAEIARESDIEEATWLAFLVAYVYPRDDAEPFASIEAARVPWAADAPPELDGVATGPRSPHDPARGNATIDAYRAWARRAGSQAAAFTGEAGWTPERRFERVFERLSLPGFPRGARFELLVSLGRLGRYELRASSLALASAPNDDVTLAAKRVFGIGDALLLERRAAALAAAADVPIEALDLALYNVSSSEPRVRGGVSDAALDDAARGRALAVLGLT